MFLGCFVLTFCLASLLVGSLGVCFLVWFVVDCEGCGCRLILQGFGVWRCACGCWIGSLGLELLMGDVA